jgi:polyhydroxyalkanoate synthesis repressor PhaR
MARKKKEASDHLVIKRYGNRRLYNTETRSYVNYQDLIKLARSGNDFQVIDSSTKEDVTKAVLIQLILEEEKNNHNILPTPFLFQLLRSNEESLQDFFKNHLTTSLAAYMRTKEEFDKRFRSLLETAIPTPQTWEKLIPGADLMRGFLTGDKKRDEEEDKS